MIHHTPITRVPYLREPVVRMVAATRLADYVGDSLDEFIEELGFDGGYVDDMLYAPRPPGETLAKFAGQLCYMSFEPGKFTPASEAPRYFDNIMAQGHGSVLEHATVALLFYGIDRSTTHELVRHRAGMAYSQVSQRYVSGATLRFVERWEYQHDATLHAMFEKRIENAAREYSELTERLLAMQGEGYGPVQGSRSRTDARKHVQQTARSCLPNETEAPILVTGNLRAWRHCLEMRASEHADTAIRRPFVAAHGLLMGYAPNIFGDFVTTTAADGLPCLTAKHRKV